MILSKVIVSTVIASLLLQTMTVYATTSPPTTYMPNVTDMEAPGSLIGIYNWSHELQNAQNISAFLPFFESIFYYVDHPTGHHVYTIPQMKTYASSVWNFSSDAKLVDRQYIKENTNDMILMNGIMNATNDVSIVGPATGNTFEVPLAEFILWDDSERVIGGDIYYDRLGFLDQLGKANRTVPDTPVPTRMASAPPETLPPGPAAAPSDDLRQRHNWLHQKWSELDLSAVLPYIVPKIQYADQATGQILITPEELASHVTKPLNMSSDAKIANYQYYLSGDQTFSKVTIYGTNDQSYEGTPATGNKF